jgi:cell division septum initiation protein DivIVA
MQDGHCMPDQSSAATEHAILQEITAPLDTLPDDPVAVVVNADFPVAMRGYDRMAVDAYIERTSQLVAELQATRSPEAAVRRALQRVGEQISGILQRAHETAEQITAQSRREAENRLEQARAEAADIAALAQQRVRDLDADTDRIWIERHRIVDDARDLAGQLLTLAQTAAEAFPEAEEAPAYAEDEGVSAPYDAAGQEEGAEETYLEEDEEDPDTYVEEDPDPTASPVQEPATTVRYTDEEQEEAEPQAQSEEPPPTPDELADAPGVDDVEKTVAFRALAPRDESEPGDAPSAPRRGGSSRSAIPPASQAANRRSSSD